MQKVPQKFQALLPSSEVNLLNLERDKTYIIESFLRNATLEAWQWMFKTYQKNDIATVVMNSKNLRKKDVAIWANYFNIPFSQILCTQKKFQDGLKSSWAY